MVSGVFFCLKITILSNNVDAISTDYIVEQGTSGIWTYRKWNSGVMEQWGVKSFTTTKNTSWHSFYITSSLTMDNYAIPFVQLPISNLSCSQAMNSWILYGTSNATTEKASAFYIIGPEAQTSLTYIVSCYAIGRWK